MTLPHLDHLFPTTAQKDGQLVVYVSGPMRGLPRFNFPAFDAARDFLVAHGHVPISPADHDREVNIGVEDAPGFAHGIPAPDGPSFADLIGWDLRVIASPLTDAVLFLPGWEGSKGAAYERDVAEACGKRFFYFDPEGPSMFEERPTRLIGVSGFAQAGKDSVGAVLQGHGFERIGFADALKAVLEESDPSVEEVVAHLGWEDAKRAYPHEPWDHTVRDLLQGLGVAVRDHVDPDAWVNAALRKVKPGGSYVITDVRFPNEYDEIKRRGGEVWRVTRPGTEPVNAHVSETALDDRNFDLVIRNDGTLEDLARTVNLYV